MVDIFRKFAQRTSAMLGTPWAFIVALLIIFIWALSGSLFAFSDTWQLVINTGTTVITFLMVFLIQNTQNRDAKTIHLKLDELIRTNIDARNRIIDLEDVADDEIKNLQEEFRAVHEKEERKKSRK
jgi:low affinity Fe/Cu permease